MPNKYKVQFVHKEFYTIDVEANTEEEANTKAKEKMLAVFLSGTHHYYENRDEELEVETVYDVTGTDDPHNP